MSEDNDRHTLSVQLANQFINTANKRLEDGMDPQVISAALRHAAANFSAFVSSNTEPEQLEDGSLVDDFQTMLTYYAERHAAQNKAPQSSLMNLVQQVQDEF